MTGHKINLHFTLCSLPLSTYRSGWPPLIWSNKTEIEMWGGAALLLLISLRAIRASVHVPSTPPQHLLRLRLFGGLSIILMQFKDLHSTPELPWQQSPPPPHPHTPHPLPLRHFPPLLPRDAERSIEYPRRCGRKCSGIDGPVRNHALCGLLSMWELTQSGKVTIILKSNKGQQY